MPSPIYQNMVKLFVGFPIWRRPSICVKVAMCGYGNFDCEIFRCGKVTTLTPLQFLISCKILFPIAGSKIYYISTLALKHPNKIVLRSVPHRSCLSHHTFYPLLGHERSEQLYDPSDLLVLYVTSYH
jgi:hypothetical protein